MANQTAGRSGRTSEGIAMHSETCPKKPQCPLFPLFQNVENLKVWQTFYCDQRFQDCERFKLASTGVRPDEDLLPNGTRLRRGRQTDGDSDG